MKTITKFGPKSVANMYGFFLAVSAFLGGLSIGFSNFLQMVLSGEETVMSLLLLVPVNLALGVFIGVVAALFAAAIGYVSGYIIAWLYNRAVRFKFIGGIKLEIE